ncbi:MAG: hypothetical protein Q8P50_16910 [Bacillota bacterium]|nr:hypothetical protein [Bacillota bacterium]
MGFWEKAQQVDRRIIYIIMIVTLAAAMIRPVGMAISVNKETQMAYDAVEKLPAGSIVWLGCDFSAGGMPELIPTLQSVMIQGFRKNLRFVAGGMWTMAGNMAEVAWTVVQPMFPNKKYGVDFVNVGYKAGGNVLLEKMVGDAHVAFAGVDHYGKPLKDLPLMNEFKSFKDIKFIFGFFTGTPGERDYIKFVGGPLGVPIAASCVAVSVPETMPFLQSGQLVGLAGGMRGAAEYEVLVKVPGRATAGMDAQAFAHLVIIAFIVIGNLGYVFTKNKSGKTT